MHTLNDLYGMIFREGGFVINPKCQLFNGGGFAVACPDREFRVPETDLTFEEMKKILAAYLPMIDDHEVIGVWRENGHVCFDVSQVFATVDDAFATGQESIFSFDDQGLIYVQ